MEKTILTSMIEYFGHDPKRINHTLKVYGFALSILEGEKVSGEIEMVTKLSAILHDIGILEAERKHQSNAGKYQEIEGPAIAEDILKNHNYPSSIIKRVSFIVGNHHSYNKIDGIDFQIVVEADFLVNIFEETMNTKAIESIESKIFKTQTGKNLLENIYLKI